MEAATPTVGVIGGGSWATALMKILSTNLPKVHWWMRNEKAIAHIGEFGHNPHYIQAIEFDRDRIEVTSDMQAVIDKCDVLVFAIPSAFLDETVQEYQITGLEDKILFSAIKGMINKYDAIPARYFHKEFGTPYSKIGLICGPCHAEEVARGLPASVVAASDDESMALRVRQAFSSETFRVYSHDDRAGAELAGALKNVIALAAGISDGLELGDNAKSAPLTRGMVEMARFGVARGASSQTFFGLAGMGDLVTTCCSKHSRNRSVGEAIGRGKTLRQVLESMQMVAEGVWTTRALFGPEAEMQGVALPIAEQVHAVLFEDKDPREAVHDLMSREPTDEWAGVL